MITDFLNKYILMHVSSHGPNGQSFEGPLILYVFYLLVSAGIFFGSFVWLYRDATKRKKNGILAILFILFTGWPISFIYWLWLRPPVDQASVINEPPAIK
jgi:hypothetical protein